MKYLFLSVLFFATTISAMAQGPLKLPALSPNAKISQDFSLSSIEIAYSRPSMRGRKVFGDIVPFNKVWRTGANAATKIKIGEDLEIGGQKVKAGEYALYTIPGKDKWEIILNNGTGNWGADGYNTDADVARFSVKTSMIDGICQTFTINITDITFSTCKIEMMWERTKVVIPVTAHNEERVDKSIDEAINKPSIPYFQAASYYYETNQNLDKAKMYVDKALETNDKAFFMWYLKARIEKKLGNKDAAIAAAQKSIDAAKGSAFEGEYKHNNEKIINELKKGTHKVELEDN